MKNLLYLFIIFSIIGCAKKMEKPKDLIPEEQMVDILTDVFIYRQTSEIEKKSAIDFRKVNNAIFLKHGVSKDRFKDSYTYYFIEDTQFGYILEEVEMNLMADRPDSLSVDKFKQLSIQKQEEKIKAHSNQTKSQ